LSIDLRELNKLKLQLTKSLLERLEQLKKAMEDTAVLQKILSEESEIAILQSLSTHDKETHKLKVRIRQLELGSERNERQIEELQEEVRRKDDNFRKLFDENQEQRFKMNMLQPISIVEEVVARARGVNCRPLVLEFVSICVAFVSLNL